MSPVHLLPMSPVYTPFDKGGNQIHFAHPTNSEPHGAQLTRDYPSFSNFFKEG